MWFGMIYCSIISENSFREESKKVKVFIEELWLFQNDLNDTLDTKNPKMALSVLESGLQSTLSLLDNSEDQDTTSAVEKLATRKSD